MIRQVQLPGVRPWAGNDLVSLQEETFKVLDSFLCQFGNTIVSGCEIVGDVIRPGLVGLSGYDAEGVPTYKVVPFSGRTHGGSFPVYLTLQCNTIYRDYGDQQSKPVAYEYYAVMSANKPSGNDYLAISNRAANNRFIPVAVSQQKETVITLNDLYAKYPDGGRQGDYALVIKANSLGAGWAYWDVDQKKWRLMLGETAPTPPVTTTTDEPVTTTTRAPRIVVSVSGSTGVSSVNGGGNYILGDVVYLSCEVNIGYEFSGWYENEVKVWPQPVYSFTATESRVLEARAKLPTTTTTEDPATTTTSQPPKSVINYRLDTYDAYTPFSSIGIYSREEGELITLYYDGDMSYFYGWCFSLDDTSTPYLISNNANHSLILDPPYDGGIFYATSLDAAAGFGFDISIITTTDDPNTTTTTDNPTITTTEEPTTTTTTKTP